MNAVADPTSSIARDLLTSLNHLQENGHELLTVDWRTFALVCGHGVAVGLWPVSNELTSELDNESR